MNHFILRGLMACVIFTSLSYSAIAQCDRERDSLALVNLYNSLGGPNWTYDENIYAGNLNIPNAGDFWNFSIPIDQWHGIRLHPDGCVRDIILTNNNLVGDLYNFDYSNLYALYLDQNNIEGNLIDFSLLPNLFSLVLSSNNIDGQILDFSNLPDLQVLLLSKNNLEGEIPNFSNLPLLSSLSIFENSLTGEIPEFSNCPDLRNLYLSANELSGNIPNLPFLNEFIISGNNLSGCFPGFICELDEYLSSNNPLLPWEGDFERFCNGEEQIGAPCNDGDPLTENDEIQVDCSCRGILVNDCRERDSLALIALYNSTDGPNWTNTWDLSEPIDMWYGIEVNGDGCVTCIDLDGEDNCTVSVGVGNNLSGTIPIELGNLNNLTGLFLSTNELSDSIPVELGNLNNLTELWLSTNELTGSIPLELGNLNNLSDLSLTDNKLTGSIPVELGNLNNLTLLNLSINELTGSIPAELGNLNSLTRLSLSNNKLTGSIPAELGNLNNLTRLNLPNNELTGSIPVELGNLNNLTALNLSINELTGSIPVELGNLNNLIDLLLYSNGLTGSIPVELGSLNNLNRLWLYTNELTGSIPVELGNLNNLIDLLLYGNELTGSIPVEMGNLNNLTDLFLFSNELTGSIPAELGSLNNLIFLYLSNNELTGSIPVELGNLNNLTQLRLDGNELEGCYPIELNSQCSVDYNFSNNPLLPWEGDFERFCNGEEQIGAPCNDGDPLTENDEIQVDCSCRGILVNDCRERDSLALIALYNSTDGPNWTNTWDLSDPIDMWYGIEVNGDGCVTCIDLDGDDDCSALTMGGNNMIGNIPVEMGDLNNLTRLYLSNNALSGSIPSEFGNLNNLTQLHLFNNDLSGSIPVELGDLNNLFNLSLSNNELSGNIPKELGNLSNLSFLNLAINNLTGRIPKEFENLTNLDILFLFVNELSGTIPSEIGNLDELISLDLKQNELTGSIPMELGNLSNLTSLDLNQNKLSGSIPKELGNLNNLNGLILFSNELSGSIPVELGNLNNLTQLRLDNNELEGCFPFELNTHCGISTASFTNNPLLPWEGDFERFCNGEEQIGAPCDDGDPLTENDEIQDDCSCRGQLINPCRESDSLALVALYNSTDGPNWTTTWDLDTPIDTWYGIEVNGDGCVTCVDLDGEFNCTFNNTTANGNNLSGELPDISLPFLEGIYIRNNDLQGMIQDWKMPSLVIIDLDGNNLTGQLPNFSGMTNLVSLYMSNNNLGSQLPNFSNLPELKILRIAGAELTGQIPDFRNCPNLTRLTLNSNELTGEIPDFDLENLITLNLQLNNLNGSLPLFRGIPNITFLSLGINNLSGPIPSEYGELTNLTNINLGSNELIGSIPSSFSQLTNLNIIRLGSNLLTAEIPEFLYTLPSIESLNLNDNNFIGCWQPSASNLCRIGFSPTSNDGYNLTGNPLLPWEGDFERFCNGEEQIGAPCNDGDPLTENDEIQDDCSCRGQLINPCRESDSLALVALYNSTDGPNWLNTWDLSDPIDTWYGIEVNGDGCVTCVDLDGIDNCSGATSINSGNNLVGTIPFEFDSLDFLEVLSLAANNIVGSIPDFKLNELITLDLSDNDIVGPIPNFSALENLINLNLSFNPLNTSLTNFNNLPNLVIMRIQFADLTGEVPDFENLLNLKLILLRDNNLEGDLPNFSLPVLEFIDIQRCELSGDLPLLQGCPKLESLILSSNEISGQLPDEYGNLTELKILALSTNNIVGEIPSTYGGLSNLERLMLNNNNLDGQIPVEIYVLPVLRDIEVARNNLSGCWSSEALDICGIGFNDQANMDGYNFSNNPLLPWEGDFERFCNGEEQIGAPCNDGDPLTENDEIQDDCSCRGQLINPCRESDSLALVALYNSTDGPNWLNTWDLSDPIDTWYGIEVNGDGCVTCVDVEDNNLNGTLNNQFSGLQSLEHLKLSSNLISGEIPIELFTLSNLISLDLASNDFSGTLPSAIGDLRNLERLSLSINTNLSGQLPCEISNLTNLKILAIGLCSFSGDLCIDFSQLSLLEDLFLQSNNFTGNIPTTISSLVNCYRIDLSANMFVGEIPAGIFDLPNLGRLHLKFNNLEGCLSNISSSHFLCNISAGCDVGWNQNDCNGGNSTVPCLFDLKFNPLLPWEGDFERFCNGEEQIGAPCNDGDPLTENDIIQDDCSCAGIIPFDCVSNIHPDYEALMTFYNSTNGDSWTDNSGWVAGLTQDSCDPCGDAWYGITCNTAGRVICIDMDGDPSCDFEGDTGNDLSGELPTEISEITELQSLILDFNNISGQIPTEITQLLQLVRFTINSNMMEGPIPAELGNLPELTIFIPGNNNFSGCYPADLMNKCGVGNFDFTNNLLMPWQGNFSNFCDGMDQLYAPCDDGDNSSSPDIIDEDCNCGPCPLIETSLDTLICKGSSVILAGETYDTPGTYQATLSNVVGCDSLINLELSVTDAFVTDWDTLICQGEFVEFLGSTFDSDISEGQVMITTADGCDSIINVTLSFETELMVTEDLLELGEQAAGTIAVLDNDSYSDLSNLELNIIETQNIDVQVRTDLSLVLTFQNEDDDFGYVDYELCDALCGTCLTTRATVTRKIDVDYDDEVLTPNDDGINDVLVVRDFLENEEIENSLIMVFNRWGELVHEEDNYKNDWGGYLNNDRSKPLPEGIYYYHLLLDTGVTIIGSRSIIR